ncbi:MAG: RimK family alpha-L-glutamate ligase [Clostridia bacterium]|nr:RimK family alpha-L-glutamate ligase [Clostridia bacterium]
MVKGAIIINPFLTPLESVHQAERLTEEFSLLGVSVKTVTDAFLRSFTDKSEIYTELKELDFAVYLDKDKYQSQILENAGVRLFNRHNAIRVCDDKAETIIALKNQNLNIPKTVFGGLCYRNDLKINALWAEKIAEQLNFPVVVKESFGSMGKGVYIANDINELIAVMEKVKLKPHIFQQYIGGKIGVDVRVIVIGGKAVAAMERRNDGDFRSNVAQGGVGVKIDLPLEFKNAAEKCAQVLGLDYCGVDLLYGVSGEPYVCEVNSNAFFSGIEKATNVNVAKLYAEHILKIVKGK